MIGNLFSKVVKVVTIPVDVADVAMDVITGGDGSKRSRKLNDTTPTGFLSDLREGVCETLKELDQ